MLLFKMSSPWQLFLPLYRQVFFVVGQPLFRIFNVTGSSGDLEIYFHTKFFDLFQRCIVWRWNSWSKLQRVPSIYLHLCFQVNRGEYGCSPDSNFQWDRVDYFLNSYASLPSGDGMISNRLQNFFWWKCSKVESRKRYECTIPFE